MATSVRQRSVCEWDDLAPEDIAIGAILAGDGDHLLPPFHLLSTPGVSAKQQRACSELWTPRAPDRGRDGRFRAALCLR